MDTHILSALWVNTVGQKLDAKFRDCCYAARLRRVERDDASATDSDDLYHVSAIGSFKPYFQPYKKWRSDGLNAIRNELSEGRKVIAVSLDLKSYYHYIDPRALASRELYNELKIELTQEEYEFSVQLGEFLNHWSKKASNFGSDVAKPCDSIIGGLVIGLTASRIVSNLLLHCWDELVLNELMPIHYGRYVDDMILVMRDTDKISDGNDLMQWLKRRLGKCTFFKSGNANENDQTWEIQLGSKIQRDSQIRLQSGKQRLFHLQGKSGIDLLSSIEKEINDLSSEFRLMPTPDDMDGTIAAKVLVATGDDGQAANTLRDADNLTIRRLGWALQLRLVETLVRDLPPKEWKTQRQDFYEFASNHVLRADKIFNFFQYLPRLFGIAIAMNDWQDAEKIAIKTYQSINALIEHVESSRKVTINGADAFAKRKLWKNFSNVLKQVFEDAFTRYYYSCHLYSDQQESSHSSKTYPDRTFKNLAFYLKELKLPGTEELNFDDCHSKATQVMLSDLGCLPYKQIDKEKLQDVTNGQEDAEMVQQILRRIQSSELIDVNVLTEFLALLDDEQCRKKQDSGTANRCYLPYIFPTRPLTDTEISELVPECVGLTNGDNENSEQSFTKLWAKYTRALRGTYIRSKAEASEQDGNSEVLENQHPIFVKIGTGKKDTIRVALTNISLKDSDWTAMARDQSNLSLDRYQIISKLINETLKLKPRPDYLLFPELSIPLRWVDSIANRLQQSRISLIAGTEYRHFIKTNELHSEVVLVLTDNRLGYPSFVKIWQPKLEPAVGEDFNLASRIGKSWAVSERKAKQMKPVYVHHGFHFGVMICSELLNSRARIRFQGLVDALMVLSWNKDLDTFASLIESTALDIHAYTILVNNQNYGDSRIRSPARKSYERDIVRLKGGDESFVVAASFKVDELRMFQCKGKRWSLDDDRFKPVPEGFEMVATRKTLPPT